MNTEKKPFSMAGMTIAKKANSRKSTEGLKKLKTYQLRGNIEKGRFQFSDSTYDTMNMGNNGLTIAYDDQIVCLCIALEKDSKFYKHKGTANKGKYFKSTELVELLKERGLIVEDKKINYFSLSNEGIDGNYMIYEISNVDIEKDSNKTIGYYAAAEVRNEDKAFIPNEEEQQEFADAYAEDAEEGLLNDEF